MELLLIRKDSCVNAYAELTQDLESIISAVSLDDCSRTLHFTSSDATWFVYLLLYS